MSFIRKHLKLLAVAGSSLTIGAGASAVAGAGAATPARTPPIAHARHAWLRPRRLLARAVHGDLVLPTKGGFATVTFDRGVVDSVSAQQLTLREGTRMAVYKTITLTIPSNARVRDNGHQATLADVTPGQRAIIVQAPKRTLVIARTPRS